MKIRGLAIGSDESLKGDTFGGIVVACFKADDAIRKDLLEMGVTDSKKLLKPQIVDIAKKIIEKYPDNYSVENIFPKDYNRFNSKMNVTQILNALHKKCYDRLSNKKKIKHIVDLYPGCSIGDIREKQAEMEYVEVAAASIIARYGALKQIRDLEKKAGFFIPMGSTHVESALIEIKKKSLNKENFVKSKFKNVAKFFK